MKTINFFKSALLAAILLIGGGNAWAETLTITKDVIPGLMTSSSNQTFTVDGIEFSGKLRYYKSNLFFTSGTDYICNTTSLGTINSITINYATGGSGSAKQYFSSGDAVINGYQSGTPQLTTSTGGTSGTYSTFAGGFFNLSISNKNMQATSIVIDYTPVASSTVATPAFSVLSGRYTETQNVEITCATEGAAIYYTTNGDDPTATSTEYSGAIPVSTTTTLKAIAIKGGESSNIASATYTILTIQQATIEDFLAASESEDVYYELTGRMSNITNTTYGNFDLTDATGTVYVYGLTATMQISNDKSFASLGLAEGDVITIRGTRASYSGTAQVGGPAYFVSKTILPVLTTPVANEATTITANSFVANWDAVDNATSYELNVWTEESVEFGIVNPSFENGLENWVAEDAYSLSTDNAHTGTQSLYFSASKTKDLRQTINNVTPGETITVSYWYYLDPTMTGNGPRLWCTWEGSDDQSLQVQDYSNVKGAWTEATISTTVPAGATALNLEIRVYNNSNGYLDDITVTQTNTSTIQVQTPITGSPFAVTETSKAITGLTAETTYHYSVVAKAESYTDSEASNIIDVTTSKGSGTGLCHPATLEGVSFDGQVIRNAAGLELSVYTVSGVCVKTAAGDIDMSAMPHGIYLVRSANAVLKITK